MEHFPSLAAKRRAAQSAQSTASKFDTEENVLQHLLDTKPTILCCGRELRIESKAIDDNLSAYIERFVRKGLVDRAERLDYLQKILRQKCGDDTQKFYTLMSFLLSMEEDSTNVESEVELGSKEYTSSPDEHEQDVDLERKTREENDLKIEILEEIRAEREQLAYSSDSELSDWDSHEEDAAQEDESKPVDQVKKPDLSRLSLRENKRRDSQVVRVETDEEWLKRVQTATDFMKGKFPQRVVTLSQQPVISAPIDLHLKFGLFWEWKTGDVNTRRESNSPQIVSEAQVIREIVCHFMSPFQENSVVLAAQDQSKLYMLPTLSCSTFNLFLKKYATIPTSILKLKKFIKGVHDNTLGPKEDQYPKIISAFAFGLSEVLRYVSVCVGDIADAAPAKKDVSGTASPRVSTLIQLDRELQKAFAIVQTLEHLFVEIFGDVDSALNFDMEDAWVVSEKLIATLEAAVRVENRIENFMISLFMFSQCLAAYLDDLMVTLERDTWPTVSIFSRNESVTLSDANFWKSSVTMKNYAAKVNDARPVRASFLEKIAPQMLMFLKTLEMLRQLNEDTSAVVGILPSGKHIVNSFLSAMVADFEDNSTAQESQQHSAKKSFPEYERYFNYMKTDDRRVFGAFRYILKEQRCQVPPSRDVVGQPLTDFLNISSIPFVDSIVVLPTVVDEYLGPVLQRGETSLKGILKEYKVQESMALFQEIILGGREDFAQAVVALVNQQGVSKRFNYQDPGSRNLAFQKLLSDFYPDGRDNFDIELRLDATSDLRFNLEVKVKFPLSLILTPETLSKYLFIAQQLFRIRKSVWNLNNLQMKDCCPGPGVDLNRALMIRFSLIHFCSSIRSFFMFKIFSANSGASWEIDENRSFEEILKAHEDYLTRIETRLLKSKLMANLILKKIVAMSDVLQKCWTKEIPLTIVLRLEEHLRHCWGAIQDCCKIFTGQEFSQLEYFTGPVPSYL